MIYNLKVQSVKLLPGTFTYMQYLGLCLSMCITDARQRLTYNPVHFKWWEEKETSLCLPFSLHSTCSSEWKLMFNRVPIISRSMAAHLSRPLDYCFVCLSATVFKCKVIKPHTEMNTHTHTLSTADSAVRMLHKCDSHPLSSSLPLTYETTTCKLQLPTRRSIN